MRLTSRARRVLALPLLLLTLQGQAAPSPPCARLPDDRLPHLAPEFVGPGARGAPVPVADGTIFARDAAETVMQAWRLPTELRIQTGGLILVYPEGLEIRPVGYNELHRICLPAATPRRPRRAGRLQPCLVDGDGDGRFEQIEVRAWNPGMQIIRVRIADRQTLARPLRPGPEPAGAALSRTRYQRGLIMRVLRPDRVDLAVRYRSFSLVTREDRDRPGRWTGAPGEVQHWQPPPPPTVAAPEPSYISWNGPNGPGDWIAVPLRPGIVEAHGLRIRVARAGAGWTMQVVGDRSRPWLRLACDGRYARFDGYDRRWP